MNTRRCLKNREGVSAIEYGLIAAGLAVAIVAAVNTLSDTYGHLDF